METKAKKRTVKGFEQAIERAKGVAEYMGTDGRQVIKVLNIVLDQASEEEE